MYSYTKAMNHDTHSESRQHSVEAAWLYLSRMVSGAYRSSSALSGA